MDSYSSHHSQHTNTSGCMRVKRLVEQGGPPHTHVFLSVRSTRWKAQVRQQPRRSWRAGRNEACPCGACGPLLGHAAAKQEELSSMRQWACVAGQLQAAKVCGSSNGSDLLSMGDRRPQGAAQER